MRQTIGKIVDVFENFLDQFMYSRSFYAFFFQIMNIAILALIYVKNEIKVMIPMIHFPIMNAEMKYMKKNGISTIPNKALRLANINDHHQSLIHPANTIKLRIKQKNKNGKGTIHILGVHSVPALFIWYPSLHSLRSGMHPSLLSFNR